MLKLKNLAPDLRAMIQAGMGTDPFGLLQRGPAGKEGKVYHVNQDSGSNNFDGLSPETPFATIDKARTVMGTRVEWTDSPWAQKDTCYIYPGVYDENITSSFYGMNFIGLGHWWDANGEMGVKIKPSSGSPIDVTSIINCTFQNIWFESPDTSPVLQVDNCNRNIFSRCHFQGLPGASPTTTKGFEVVKDLTGNIFQDVTIWQCRNGFYLDTDNANSKQIVGTIFRDCIVGGADQKAFYVEDNCNPAFSFLIDCILGDNSVTCAEPIDDNTSQMTCVRCYLTGTTITPATGSGKYQQCYHNGSLVA